MAGTFKTREPIDAEVTGDLKDEIAQRVKAGCVRCYVETTNGKRTLVTEWNVLGEND
jgi:hypothetical protein